MAEQVDVIVSAFATPGNAAQRAIAQDPSLLANPNTKIVQVPFSQEPGEVYSAPAFERTAQKCKSMGGSVLQGLFSLVGLKEDPRSITLISFSGGTTFLDKVLADRMDAQWVDAVVVLDGLHFVMDFNEKPWPQELDPWVNFGMRAANDRALLVTSHTNIARPSKGSTSTTEGSRFLYDGIQKSLDEVGLAAVRKGYDPMAMMVGPPPPAVSITGGSGDRMMTKTWEVMPAPKTRSIGNAFDFDFGGNHESDHIFQAVYVQRAIWKTFLSQRIGAPVGCASVAVAATTPFATQGCRSDKTIVPAGMYARTSGGSYAVPFAIGAMAGIGAGYWLKRKGYI